MALYAIGDLHLSFSADKPMDVFGREWKNHTEKIKKHWNKIISDKDTVVITGDHSWGRTWSSAGRILFLLISCPEKKFFSGETMICSGMPKRRSV